MNCRTTGRALRALAALSLIAAAASAEAQVVGENVNMVSGTQWPGGDPFLQRQNEPTLAVSSVNSQHLLAGVNDYRSVDVPDPAYGKMAAGDAWLGVFKSLDGGQTWRSVLLPGYPQDTSSDGVTSPLKTTMVVPKTFNATPAEAAQIGKAVSLPGSADPVMRAGTDGMFYYLGINFARDRSVSRLFVARLIDLNNKENGDATRVNPATGNFGSDPVKYLDTQVVARSTDTSLNGGKQIFIDKPWMAVDVPRAGAKTCTVPDPDNRVTGTRTILAGTVWVAWAQFAPNDVSSDIMITSSADCGLHWSTPRKLNTASSALNQGVALAIEPLTGRVVVAWRRVASGKQVDAIMATRSNARKKAWSAPRVVARIVPFDLGGGAGQARTQTMPTMAISSDGATSWVHLAWASRDGAGGPSRVWTSTAKLHAPPAGDQDPDEADSYEPETRLKWSAAARAGLGAAADDLGHAFTRGHQFMPSLATGQGRLVLFYYDSRFDHLRRYYRPYPVDASGRWTPDPTGKFYQEELGPIGDLADPTLAPQVFGAAPLTTATGAVLYRDLDDTALTRTRHTVDVRVGMATPGPAPTFTSQLVSRLPFGLTGEESTWDYTQPTPRGPQDMKVAGFGPAGTDPAAVAGALTVMTAADQKVQLLEQVQLNIPGFPMFKGASTAFMGDYVDIQGQGFVATPAGWAFNVAPSRAPVFHAVWTSNQDVKAPPYGADGKPQWGLYTPVTLWLAANRPGGGAMLFDGGRADPNVSNAPVAVCDPATTGSRDQNVYTARITDGLQVSTPQNAKVLNGQSPVGFVVAAANTTALPMTVTFLPPTLPAGPKASYTTDFASPVSQVTVQLAPFSSAFRTLFVVQGTSLNSAPTIQLTVRESAGCGAAGQPACREGSLTFNPPVALSTLVAPDGASAAPGVAGETYFAAIGVPNVSNPNVSNPNVSNPNVSNPNVSNPNVSNMAVSDASYTITNQGNTTTSYHVKVVGDAALAPDPLQLIVSKTYKTPAAVGCALKEVAHDQVVVSVPDVRGAIVRPTDTVSTGVADPNVSNATVSLAPGETAVVTLRGYVPATRMAQVAAALTPAPVPAIVPPTTTATYQDWAAVTGQAPLFKIPTVVTVTPGTSSVTASASVAPGSTADGPITGTYTFVLTRGGADAIIGTAFKDRFSIPQPTVAFTPAPGDVFTVFYSGDDRYAASSSNATATMTSFRLLGYSFYPDRASVGLETVAGVVISSGATVVVTASHPSGSSSGPYTLTFAGGSWQGTFSPPIQADSTVSVTASVGTPGGGTLTGSASALLPATPSIAMPLPAQSLDVTAPTMVSWNYASPYIPDLFHVWTTLPGGAGGGPIYTAPGSSTFFEMPAAGASVGGQEVRVEAVGQGTLAGPLSASSYFSAKSTPAVVPVTYYPPSLVSVSALPLTVSLWSGQSSPFIASVTGTANTAVTWTVVSPGGGTITPAGLYTAPATAGTYLVQATSVADPTAVGQAAVIVTGPPPPMYVDAYWSGYQLQVGVCRSSGPGFNTCYSDAAVVATYTNGLGQLVTEPLTFGAGNWYWLPVTSVPRGGTSITLTFSQWGESASATALVPEVPVWLAPASGLTYPLGTNVTLAWSSATDPTRFNLVLHYTSLGASILGVSHPAGTSRGTGYLLDGMDPGPQYMTLQAETAGTFSAGVEPTSRFRLYSAEVTWSFSIQ